MKRLSGLFGTTKTAFQILSDLYLDHESQYLTFHIPVSAPYLILAGNIGRLADYDLYLSFLIRRCNLYEKVYLVLGSLEFQGVSHWEGMQLVHQLEKEAATRGRLQILYRKKVDVPGTNVTLLGCTLWSHIPDVAVASVLQKAPEFDSEIGIRRWDVGSHNEEHFKDISWLRTELNSHKNLAGSTASPSSSVQRILVSSFTPDLRNTLPPWQVHSPWCHAYGTDLLNNTDWVGIKYWIHGTTGRTGKVKRYGVKVVSNQRGCVGEDDKGILKDGMSDKDKEGIFDITKVIKV